MEWYRGEDAGNLKRSELNEVVENLTCLNAFEVKIWKSDEKVVMDDKFNQKMVMNENSGKNFVMNAKIDPKVVMDLSIFKIGGWNSLQPINQHWSEEFIDENEPWLFIGIPSRDPFLVTQYLERHSVSSDRHMKKLMSLGEGLHVMMQCYMDSTLLIVTGYRRTCIVERTYDEEIYKRINHLLRKRTCMQMECSEDAIRIE